MKKLLFFIPVILLAGCMSSYMTTKSTPAQTPKNGESPSIDKVSTTDVGSPIYAEFDYMVTPAVRLNKKLTTHKKSVPSGTKLTKVYIGDTPAYMYHNQNEGRYGEFTT